MCAKKTSLNRIAACLTCTMFMLSAPTISDGAGLKDQMDSVFNEMTNVTPPGVFEGQRRGVLSGGRYTAKSRLFTENLVSISPPSFKAGCGGVDLFGGSFSFINSDQLIQLFRSIAANAKGYAFQLALDAVSPSISNVIQTMQRKVQELNQYFGNSCQMAQGIVNDVASSFGVSQHNDASLVGTTTGIFSDFFESNTGATGRSPELAVKQDRPDDYKKMVGNIVWKELQRNGVASWFTGGDSEMLEAMMSVTGTVIVKPVPDDDSSAEPIIRLPGNKLSLQDLVDGGSVSIYSCGSDTDECMVAGESGAGMKTITLDGLAHRIEDLFTGAGGAGGGIIEKWNNKGRGVLTNEERAISANLPAAAGTLIQRLSVRAPTAATLFVQESSNAIAARLSKDILDQLLRATRMALASSIHPRAKEAIEELDRSRNRLDDEYNRIKEQYGSIDQIIARYNQMDEVIDPRRYVQSAKTGD